MKTILGQKNMIERLWVCETHARICVILLARAPQGKKLLTPIFLHPAQVGYTASSIYNLIHRNRQFYRPCKVIWHLLNDISGAGEGINNSRLEIEY